MHLYSEAKLIRAIGMFSTTGAPLAAGFGFAYHEILKRSSANQMTFWVVPAQCQAFLNSSEEFIWFIEEHTLTYPGNPAPEAPKVNFQNKTVYPAKVTGLGLPLLSASTGPVALLWREGLVRWSSQPNFPSQNYDSQSGNFRPGFGEIIPADLQRPFRIVTVPINNIGLAINSANQNYFTGPAGRLFSMAFYVDPEIATKYRNSKKKRKSLNSQDYEINPTYPPYTPYSGGGYGG